MYRISRYSKERNQGRCLTQKSEKQGSGRIGLREELPPIWQQLWTLLDQNGTTGEY